MKPSYSGDTAYRESLARAAAGCDILVQEVYSAAGLARRTPGPDLGSLAAEVHPKTLGLHHELPMGKAPEEVIAKIRAQFAGQVVYGKDLDVIR